MIKVPDKITLYMMIFPFLPHLFGDEDRSTELLNRSEQGKEKEAATAKGKKI